jgi:hypothetical protein
MAKKLVAEMSTSWSDDAELVMDEGRAIPESGLAGLSWYCSFRVLSRIKSWTGIRKYPPLRRLGRWTEESATATMGMAVVAE